jgi:hypothetical protein
MIEQELRLIPEPKGEVEIGQMLRYRLDQFQLGVRPAVGPVVVFALSFRVLRVDRVQIESAVSSQAFGGKIWTHDDLAFAILDNNLDRLPDSR